VKVLHLSTYDIFGGAAQGAFCIHESLLSANVGSAMRVANATACSPPSKYRMLGLVRNDVGRLACLLLRTGNRNLHSRACLPSSLPTEINLCDANLVHLHWVCGSSFPTAGHGTASANTGLGRWTVLATLPGDAFLDVLARTRVDRAIRSLTQWWSRGRSKLGSGHAENV